MSRVFSYPYVGVVFDKSILSSRQILAYTDSEGNLDLDSFWGTKQTEKYTE